MKEKLTDDLEKYISKRKRIDKIFAKEFNSHKSAISRIENLSFLNIIIMEGVNL